MQRRPRSENADSGMRSSGNYVGKRRKKYAMARRGLRSLGIAIGVPMGLTVVTIYLATGGAGHKYGGGMAKPFWYPPLWLFHLSALSTSGLMSLSAWLVWADGGFHQHSAALPLFVAQFLLSQIWAPIVFRSGAAAAGLAVSVGLFLALVGCSMTFKRVNPIAADLVKPCLAWAGRLPRPHELQAPLIYIHMIYI